MTTLKHYNNPDEIEERAKDNKEVDLEYIGFNTTLKGKGKGYFIPNENPDGKGGFFGQWYFRPNGSEEVYRVNPASLNFEE